MKKIKVTDKNGSIEYINDGEVLNRLHLMGHGQAERWVHENQPHDPMDIIEERIIEDSPAIQ